MLDPTSNYERIGVLERLSEARIEEMEVKDMRICIIGAGMGGLTCALALARRGFQNIQVFETASNLGFVGAGIQLAPNMARVLDRLGVWKEIEREAVVLNSTSIRRGNSDDELGHVDLRYIQETYKYPHMVGHRASLANALFNGCKSEPSIRFCFSTSVVEIISFFPKPTISILVRGEKSNSTVAADVLLAADGVKSHSREQLLAQLDVPAHVQDTGQAAYRIMLQREQMQQDPELLKLVDADMVTRWIGEKRHIIAYPVSSKTIYNISTVQPDTHFASAPSANYTTKGSKRDMLQVFSDFCPKIQRMLSLVPEGEVCEWKLRVHAPLPTWVHGTVALVGDACHPTLPHLAQGAAQAIEDAAVLAVVLAHLGDAEPESINTALRSYERVRKERAETLVEMAAASGRRLHLADGEAKDERDREFAALKSGKGPVPDKWADAEVQKMIYGFDCVEAAESLDTF